MALGLLSSPSSLLQPTITPHHASTRLTANDNIRPSIQSSINQSGKSVSLSVCLVLPLPLPIAGVPYARSIHPSIHCPRPLDASVYPTRVAQAHPVDRRGEEFLTSVVGGFRYSSSSIATPHSSSLLKPALHRPLPPLIENTIHLDHSTELGKFPFALSLHIFPSHYHHFLVFCCFASCERSVEARGTARRARLFGMSPPPFPRVHLFVYSYSLGFLSHSWGGVQAWL